MLDLFEHVFFIEPFYLVFDYYLGVPDQLFLKFRYHHHEVYMCLSLRPLEGVFLIAKIHGTHIKKFVSLDGDPTV